MRIKKTAAVACLSAAALLAACQGKTGTATNTSSDNGHGNITFAMGSNDTDKLKPVIEKWNSAHPNEKVALKELAADADAQDAKMTQVLQAKSDEIDVLALDVTWTAKYAANGWIAPLEGDLKIKTDDLLPATVESGTYNGKLYAAPMNTNAQLLYYRTDVVKQAPKTWSDLTKDCAAAKAKDMECLVTQLKQYAGLTVNTSEFINSWGGSIVDTDGKTPTVDSAKAKAGLTALVDAYKNGDISKASTGYQEDGTHTAFMDGKAAFAYNWPYMYDKAAGADSKVAGKYDVTTILGPDGPGASTLGGYNNAININSKHKATAHDFIEFIEGKDTQTEFTNHSFPPVLKSVYDDKTLVDKYGYLPALKAALENAKPRPVTPFYPAVDKAIQDNAYAAITGKKTVDEALKDMAAAITAAQK